MSQPVEFRPPAYRALIKSLGESDAVVEWLEVGVREIEKVNKLKGDAAALQLAGVHGVRVNTIDLGKLRNRSARLQILATYSQIDHFMHSVRNNHPRYSYNARVSIKGVLIDTLNGFNIKSVQVGKLEVDLFEYYREIRNLIMHDPEGDQAKADKKTCESLHARVKKSAYGNLTAPNVIDKLCFDDFVLFTRAGKQLASNLCTEINPSDDELAEYALANVDLMKKTGTPYRNPRRRENLVAGFFHERYGIPDIRSRRVAKLVLETC